MSTGARHNLRLLAVAGIVTATLGVASTVGPQTTEHGTRPGHATEAGTLVSAVDAQHNADRAAILRATEGLNAALGRVSPRDRDVRSTDSAASVPSLPLCEVEDASTGPSPCWWDAQVQGNGEGTSTVVVADGPSVEELHRQAEVDLAAEVVGQCASEVSGWLDALAEGEDGELVPSPSWGDLQARCAAELTLDPNLDRAIAAVSGSYVV